MQGELYVQPPRSIYTATGRGVISGLVSSFSAYIGALLLHDDANNIALQVLVGSSINCTALQVALTSCGAPSFPCDDESSHRGRIVEVVASLIAIWLSIPMANQVGFNNTSTFFKSTSSALIGIFLVTVSCGCFYAICGSKRGPPVMNDGELPLVTNDALRSPVVS